MFIFQQNIFLNSFLDSNKKEELEKSREISVMCVSTLSFTKISTSLDLKCKSD